MWWLYSSYPVGYQNHTASGLDVMGNKGKGTWPVKRTYTRAHGSK